MSQPPPPAGPNPAGNPPPPALPTNSQPAPSTVKRPNPLTSKPAIGIGSFVIGIALGAGLGGGSGTADVTTQPPTAMTSAATPTPSATSALTTPATTTAASPTPAVATATAKPNYKTLSSRQFKLIAKDPDAHAGKTYVIYGEITQFDSATGTDAFRADTGPKKLRISYGFVNYPQNSILTGSEARLKKLVEGDCFRAKVTVVGSYSYDTQIGGNTTVPLFRVDAISVYGSTS